MSNLQIINPLQLTKEQFSNIEKLAALNYSAKDVAVYLGVDIKLFVSEYYNTESEVRFTYDRGRLRAAAEKDKAILDNATSGNITAYQESNKSAEKRAFENHKNRILNEG